MKNVLAITDDTVLATSVVINVLQELGNEDAGKYDSQIITQAFSLSKFLMSSHVLFQPTLNQFDIQFNGLVEFTFHFES